LPGAVDAEEMAPAKFERMDWARVFGLKLLPPLYRLEIARRVTSAAAAMPTAATSRLAQASSTSSAIP